MSIENQFSKIEFTDQEANQEEVDKIINSAVDFIAKQGEQVNPFYNRML